MVTAGSPFAPPHPPQKVHVAPCLQSFQGMRHVPLLVGGPNWGFPGGANKLRSKNLMCFRLSRIDLTGILCVCFLLKDSKLLLKASSLQTELHGLATEFQKFPRVTSIGSGDPQKIPQTPAEPRRAPESPRREPPQRPLRTPMRGKFPQEASRRVVPLRWCPSQTLEFFNDYRSVTESGLFLCLSFFLFSLPPLGLVRERQRGGGKLRGEGKTEHKTPPQKRLWNPPPPILHSPPFVHALSFPLEETGTDQINPTF